MYQYKIHISSLTLLTYSFEKSFSFISLNSVSDKTPDSYKAEYFFNSSAMLVFSAWLLLAISYGDALMTSRDLTTLEHVKEKIKLYEEWKSIQEQRKAIFNPNTRIGAAILVDEKGGLWQCMTGKESFHKPNGIIHTFRDLSAFL